MHFWEGLGYFLGRFRKLPGYFFKKKYLVYSFLEQGERREKERERNIDVWLLLMQPCLGIEPVMLWFVGQRSAHRATPARAPRMLCYQVFLREEGCLGSGSERLFWGGWTGSYMPQICKEIPANSLRI